MKVLLVNPRATDTRQIWPPLGLLHVSAILRQTGHTVKILDMLALKSTEDDLGACMKEFGPDVVGTGYATIQSHFAQKIIEVARQQGRKTIIGGPHPTALPKRALQETGADAAYLWEVEHTIASTLKDVVSGDVNGELPGIAYLRDGELVMGRSPKPIVKLDELPELDYSEIPIGVYARHQQTVRFPRQKPMMTIVTSRGCPWNCTFCMNFMGRQWRYKSADRVLGEIDSLVKDFGIREIWILDDNFTLKKSRVLEICEGLKQRDYGLTIRFPNGVRADRIDREIVKALKEVGCYNMAFGIESGNQAILDALGKGETLDTIREAISLANSEGIITSGFFVLGLPGDTEATIEDTINFAISSGLSDAAFFIATPYPGSKLYWDMKAKGLEVSWDELDQDAFIPLSCTDHISAERLVQLVRKANRRFYFRPKVFFHVLKYLAKPSSFVIFRNKLLAYLGLRSGNI